MERCQKRLEASWRRFQTCKNNDFAAYICEKSLTSGVHYSKVKISMCMLTEQFLAALWKRVEVFRNLGPPWRRPGGDLETS